MKNYRFFYLLAWLILVSNCGLFNNDDNDTPTEPTISAIIDGQNWTADIVESGSFLNSGPLTIIRGEGPDTTALLINISNTDIEVGPYDVNSHSNNSLSFERNGPDLFGIEESDFKITITKLDLDKNLMSGTFEDIFFSEDDVNARIQITGEFTNVAIH